MKKNSWLSELSQDAKLPNYTSQRGEDRIIEKIFEIIGVESKWCVEFGAADGKRGSNTWHWINSQGWSTVQIEGKVDKDLLLRQKRDTFEALRERYKNNGKVICLNEYVQARGAKSLDALLAGTPIPKRFDLLSIDIDGEDYAVWQGLKKYEPRVVVVEHNKTIPIELDFYSVRGSSLRALTRLGKEKGYELAAATIVNGIFVKKEYFNSLEINHNSPEVVWMEHSQFRKYLFQLYDGTIVIKGNNKLRWERGEDGTVEGQLRVGKFIWIGENDKTIDDIDKQVIQVKRNSLVSGRLRHWLYKVLNRI
jgi:hypothetical protein